MRGTQAEAGSERALLHSPMDDRNSGARRARRTVSNAYPYASNRASLHAGPINDTPTGSPCTYPAGTVRCGYPATAHAVDAPPR